MAMPSVGSLNQAGAALPARMSDSWRASSGGVVGGVGQRGQLQLPGLVE
jgi:hypothetical protein